MKLRFLKVRMQADIYERLKNRAAESGKPISTFACSLMEHEDNKVEATIQLIEIHSLLQELLALQAASKNSASNNEPTLYEVLLIVRELALEQNAQILSRVSSQTKNQLKGQSNEQ